ncbi:MAG: hypothetical protein IH613_02710 [Desulfuromonadales bacterium]|nr:hypothetical protein [Desulfuromonadales bacterium]
MNGSDIFNQAFSQIREPRSEEYRRGVLAALEFRCEAVPIPRLYRVGSVQFDAFISGVDEGHRRWRDALDGEE